MSCGINPLTGRKYCEEKRERLALAARKAVTAAASGNAGATASAIAETATHAAQGAGMMAKGVWTSVGGKMIRIASGNRRADD